MRLNGACSVPCSAAPLLCLGSSWGVGRQNLSVLYKKLRHWALSCSCVRNRGPRASISKENKDTT